ncbi:hypothetical protein BC828DRAFT_217607 [Blastocladiella britannica]|nr:hypothetical protein BC828DRAFT_217607 [Blastocladiella britannica]
MEMDTVRLRAAIDAVLDHTIDTFLFGGGGGPLVSTLAGAPDASAVRAAVHAAVWPPLPPGAVPPATAPDPNHTIWSVVLWNDEHHSFDHVIRATTKALSCSRADADRIANTVDAVGRAILCDTPSLDRALAIARMLAGDSEAPLGVSVQPKHGILREEAAAVGLQWLHSLATGEPAADLPGHDVDLMADPATAQSAHAIIATARTAILASLFAPHSSCIPAVRNGSDAALAASHPALVDPSVLPTLFPAFVQTSASANSPPPSNLAASIRASAATRPLEALGALSRYLYAIHGGQTASSGWSAMAARPSQPQSPLSSPTAAATTAATAAELPVSRTTRLSRLLLIDHKLWKQPRSHLADLLVASAVVDLRAKPRVGHSLALMYPAMAATHAALDREPDLALVSNLAVQLWTNGALARELVTQSDFWETLVRVVGWGLGLPLPRYLGAAPSLADAAIKTDLDVAILRTKEYRLGLGHLRYIVQCESVHPHMQPAHLHSVLHLLLLLDNQRPQQRATNVHVEFEDESWIELYKLTSTVATFLATFCKPLAGNAQAVLATSAAIAAREAREGAAEGAWRTAPCGAMVRTGSILNDRRVSLYHPLQIALAYLLQPGQQQLQNQDSPFLSSVTAHRTAHASLTLLAFISHVQAGLWVRNGALLRQLVAVYADSALRSAHVAVVRAAAVASPRDTAAWILAEYGIYPGHEESALVLDAVQRGSVVEDVLVLMAALAAQDPAKLQAHDRLRVELVHALAVENRAYSELADWPPRDILDAVGEAGSAEAAIDAVLGDIASMVRGTGSVLDAQAAGAKYALKRELLADVNPMFLRYSRNDRRAVERVVRDAQVANLPAVDPTTLRFLFRPVVGMWLETVLADANLHEMRVVVDSAVALIALMACDSGIAVPAADLPPPLIASISGSSWSPWETLMAAYPRIVKAVAELPAAPVRDALFKVMCSRIRPVVAAVAPATLVTDEANAAASAGKEQAAAIDAAARKRAAMERQRAAMAAMQQQQMAFAANFADEFSDDEDEDGHDGVQTVAGGTTAVDEDDDEEGDDAHLIEDPSNPLTLTCLVCQQAVADDGPRAGYAARVETSELLRVHDESEAGRVLTVPGLYLSACGHVAHEHCLDGYLTTVRHRHATQGSRNHPEIVALGEYLCGACKALCNALVYIDPAAHRLQARAAARAMAGTTAMGRRPVSLVASAVTRPELATRKSTPVLARSLNNALTEKIGVKQAATAVQLATMGGQDAAVHVPFRGIVPVMSSALDRWSPLLATFTYTVSCIEAAHRIVDQDAVWVPGSPLVIQRLPSATLPFLRQFALNVRAGLVSMRYLQFDEHAGGAMAHDPFAWLVLATLCNRDFSGTHLPAPAATPTRPRGPDAMAVDPASTTSTSAGATRVVIDPWQANMEMAFRSAVAQQGLERSIVLLRKALLLRAATVAGVAISPYLEYDSELETLAHALQLPWPMPPQMETIHCRRQYQDYPEVYHLVSLPSKLDGLIAQRMSFVCAQCQTSPKCMGLCLICGTGVCLQSFCCTTGSGHRGEANSHARRCSGDIGLFVDVTSVVLLVLHEEKGQFLPVPYLDAHGELDFAYQRGRPMTLDRTRFAELEALWRKQDLGSWLARRIEGSHDVGGWETF